jgi:HlyD family type I secretion membrane fusion protein
MDLEKVSGKETENTGEVRMGNRERRLLSEAVQIENELVPAFVRPTFIIVGGMVVLFLIWASLTHLTEVARGPGEILPIGQIKVVEHLDGGTVEKIFVEERQLVQKGDPLISIDGTQIIAELKQMQARFVSLQLRAERLEAFADERHPKLEAIAGNYLELLADQMAIYRNQMASLDSTLSILDNQIEQRTRRIHQLEAALDVAHQHQDLTGELATMREDLSARHLINRSVLLETRRAKVTAEGEVERLTDEIKVISQELAEIKNRRLDTQNQLRRDALAERGTVGAEAAEVEIAVKRLQEKVGRLVVRAPHRGHVHDIKVQTVGQVVQPGAIIMQVVPDDAPLEVVIKIAMNDIGFVKVGQPVNIRVTSFDYARLGFAKGTLKKVTISSIVDPDGNPYYRGWVNVTQPYVGNVPGRYPLQPGMSIEGDIVTGDKTLIAYLAKPLINAITYSFKER